MAQAEHDIAAQHAADVATMVAIASGESSALGQLYDRYASVMLALGLRIVGERGAAEDLLHDVFVEVWQRAADYDRSRGSVRAWLLLRMRSRALDRVRSAHRRKTDQLDEGAVERLEGRPTDPSIAAERRLMQRALAELPDEQRDVLELAYYVGLTTVEIGERVGVPVGTVKSRMNAARAKLRAALAEQ